MMNRTQSITAIGILCVLLVLGSLDAFFTRENFFPVSEESAESSVPNTEEQMEEDDTSYTQSNVADIIQSQQFTTLDTQESSIMEQVVDETEVVRSHTLLKDNDRAGFVAWLDSTRTELYFRALKEALHESFSPQVQDLIDDVLSEEEGPERHMLTFLDPNLSDERFVFIRLENRLYEFHITEGKDDSIFALIEELTH